MGRDVFINNEKCFHVSERIVNKISHVSSMSVEEAREMIFPDDDTRDFYHLLCRAPPNWILTIEGCKGCLDGIPWIEEDDCR